MTENSTIRPRRSFIFTPGLRPDMFPKALASGADIVCVELEDGIAPKDKAAARARALALFAAPQVDDGVERIVRINSMRERFGIEDVQAILASPTPPPALMMPKIRTPDEVVMLDQLLSEAGHATRLHVIIETNAGLEACYDIAHCSPRIDAMFFGGAILLKEDVPRARVIGAVIAFVGLSVMLWPVGQAVPESIPVLAMICAATGWAVYSVLGREVKLAIAATGTNFMLALPISAVLILLLPHNMPMLLTAPGIWLAVLSGAITSGLSYSFWYYVLPRTRTSIAGVAQLLIPAFTMTGGIIVLDETLTIRFVVSFFIVALGVALSLGIVPVGRGHHPGQPR